MPTMTRTVETDDLRGLEPLDAAYAARFAVPALVDRAVLAYYARSAHAFVRDEAGALTAFAFAHAVWDGGRPAVRLSRIVAEGDAPLALRALLDAVVKSAYDAGVYDLVAESPADDGAALAALEGAAFERRPVVRLERVLGSRSGERVAP